MEASIGWSRRRGRVGADVPAKVARSPVVDLAIVLSSFAALAHAVAVPAHLRTWPAAGIFFIALALAQAAFAVVLVRDRLSPAMTVAALWATVGVLCLYVVSRTAGLPFSPQMSAHGGRLVAGQSISPRTPEGIGPLDISTLIAELLLVVVLLSVIDRRARTRSANALAVVGVVLWTLGASGVL